MCYVMSVGRTMKSDDFTLHALFCPIQCMDSKKDKIKHDIRENIYMDTQAVDISCAIEYEKKNYLSVQLH